MSDEIERARAHLNRGFDLLLDVYREFREAEALLLPKTVVAPANVVTPTVHNPGDE